jgi:imidazolonepropionase-like amidohydrolase
LQGDFIFLKKFMMKRKATAYHSTIVLTTAIFFLFVIHPNINLAQSIILTNANIVDGLNGQVLENASLLIENGKIKEVSTTEITSSSEVRVLNLKGKYVMPGMIDAHVHLRDLAAAKRALMSGVTTVRSMGVPHFMDVGMRELAKSGKIDLPEVLAAGYHVRLRPADELFMDHPELSDWIGRDVKGEEAMKTMANIMASHGVNWIKTNATARAGLPQTDPREPYYNASEMRALVAAGAQHDIPVAAHAHGDEGGRAAVEGGVRSIEHGTYLSKETLAMMAQKGTYLVPTIAIVNDLTMPGGDYDQPLLMIRGRHMLPRVREMARNAYQSGVKIVAATDTDYGSESTLRLGQELEELVGIGMSNLEVIQAATSRAAELLQIDHHTGRIAEGLDADLLIIERNPLENVKAVYDPLMIINNGKIIINRLTWGEE